MRGSMAATLALILVACAEGSPSRPGGEGGHGTGSGGGGVGGGTPSACGPVVEGARCLDTGWCWDAPRPQAVHFADIEGTPDGTSVWAVGTLGGAFRRCEGAWVPIETGTTAGLAGVWHPSADMAVAVGEAGTVLRWDGQEWSKVHAPTTASLRAVWGASPHDVWIGGAADEQGAVLLHYDGDQITRVDDFAGYSFDIASIHGGGGRVFAVGGTFETDVSLHHDGTSWKAIEGGHGYPDFGPMSEVLVTEGATFAIFDGFNTSRIYRYEGYGWTEVLYHQTSSGFHALFADASGHAAVVETTGNADSAKLLRFDTDTWTHVGTLPGAPRAAWAQRDTNHAFAAGDASMLLSHAEGVWTQAAEITAFPSGPMFIGGSSDDDLWVVTVDHTAHRDATGWTVEPLPEIEWIADASVDLDGRPYLVAGYEGILYRDEGTWKALPSSGGSFEKIFAVSPDDVWATSDYEPLHFSGGVWEVYSGYCTPFGGAAGSGWLPDGYRFRRAPDGVVWLVGDRGAFAFDAAHTCKQLMGPGGATFEYDALVDVAWPGGELWTIGWSGTLHRREGNVLVSHGNALAGLGSEYAQVVQMSATPSGNLRITFTDSTEQGSQTSIVTVDPATAKAVGAPLALPAAGVAWTPDDEHTVIATDGGVLRYGYDE